MKILFSAVAPMVVVTVLATHTAHPLAENSSLPNCLYGKFTRGEEKTAVQPCEADTKSIGVDPAVLAVMRTFGIPLSAVLFQSCPGGRFSAMPDGEASGRFLIRYPSHAKSNYLAPIVHELAHVVQMRSAGGLEALKPQENLRRIELGADFLAGLAFNISLKGLDGGGFETNLELAGSYEVSVDHHGPPEQRAAAFRRGLNRTDPYPDLTIDEALKYWNANDYALTVR